jgi:CubicO group peptidase (beta-lactamase class C family)
MSFESYVEQAVLGPAGMTDTAFALPAGLEAATGYVRLPKVADPLVRRVLPAGVVGTRHRDRLSFNPFYVDGPAYGGLVGSVLDVGRFLQLHLRDGELDGRRVISPANARLMRAIDRPGTRFDHGLGWFRRRPRRTGEGVGDWVEHLGTGAGFWNVMRLYPARGLGVAIMANTSSAYDFDPLFAEVVARCGRGAGRD